MRVEDIRKGDIVTYRNGRVNNVNKAYNYHYWYNEDFKNPLLYWGFDIIKIERYVKFLCFYRLKTIYKRGE